MLYETLEPLRRTSAPLDEIPAGEKRRPVRWVEPQRVAEIDFRDWTHGGLVRHAAYQGLREDKSAAEVVGERTNAKSDERARMNEAMPGIDETKLTHPERLLWPDVGITKLGLAQFYAEIWTWIRPHIVERPLSLLRCPDGADKKCFFQKHAHASFSKSVRRIKLPGDDEEWIYIDDFDGLLGLVQASVLELHPWGSTIKNSERADRVILDLDPGPGVEWEEMIAAAQETRQVLADCKLQSFVKTTGGKGLHVVAPLKPAADWAPVKEFAQSVAKALERRDSTRYTATVAKKARDRRIYVDYLRNSRGATAVAAYSTRARQGAPVSTPLTWDELSSGIGPAHFTVLNLIARLRHLNADPWAGLDQVRQKLPKPLALSVVRHRPG